MKSHSPFWNISQKIECGIVIQEAFWITLLGLKDVWSLHWVATEENGLCELALVSVHHPLTGTGTNPIESNNVIVTVFCVVFDGKATRARPLVRCLFAKKGS